MTLRTLSLPLALCTALLAACGARPAPETAQADAAAPDQGRVCEVGDWRVASAGCKPGQKIVFLPQSWGNEQLPVLFAALNCDLRYQVVATRGAVTCIFAPVKPEQPAAAESPASAASGR